MTAHSISDGAPNVLLSPLRKREDALSINCAPNCTLLKAVQMSNSSYVVNSWLVHALLDKTVNK